MIQPGWYVVAFHEIAWEESPYLSGFGITYPPDAFARCARQLAGAATLIGIEEGFQKWQAGALDKPYVSFWFDDGYAGVRRYALPVLKQLGVVAGMSVCSRFANRTEMFWRSKLSYLSTQDGMRFVRTRLRDLGLEAGHPVRNRSLDLFSPAVLAEVDAVYQKFTREIDRADAFRLFDTWDGMRALAASGWTIGNHSAAHYPLLEASALSLLSEQFEECERVLETELGGKSQFWVAPFDRSARRAPHFQAAFDPRANGRTLVLVGNRYNRAWHAGKPLSRIAPPADLANLLQTLERAQAS